MSQYYDVGDETVWNPSNGAARLFHAQLGVFEAELGVPSGIGPLENDECRIDPAALGVFTGALLARHGSTGHAVVIALSQGFVATVLVLAERAGAHVRWPPPPAAGSPEGGRDVQLRLRPPGPTATLPPPAGPSSRASGSYEASRLAELRSAARELSGSMPR
ncbi:DUF6086 family protein [Streptomyces sp. NPDC006544]|uniref:DUF6086 family protein n=1 Tax=Streptomyces sp. NPDC006544 TaxID=3154583 RepID=UPI00339FEB03